MHDKVVAAMLDELTIEANEEYFVIVLQHGGNNTITCRRSGPEANIQLKGKRLELEQLKISGKLSFPPYLFVI